MDEVSVEIRNGYGIEKLNHKFMFDGNSDHPQQNTHIVYAQNGVMKSSFAKVLNDYSKGNPIKDHIFDIPGSCTLRDNRGVIDPSHVLAVASFDNGEFESQKVASLLVNATLRAEYESHMNRFNIALNVFLDRLKRTSGIGSRTTYQELIELVCTEYGEDLPKTPQTLITILNTNRSQIEEKPDYIQKIPYSVTGSNDTLKFAKENAGIIHELMKVYDEVKGSASFVRGKFDSGNAQKLVDIVDKTSFLNVDHEIELYNQSTEKYEKVKTLTDLQDKLSTDIDRILSKKPELKKQFEKMIKDLSTATRSGLKKALEENETKDVILYMNTPSNFRRSMWEGYLKGCLEEADALIAIQAEIRGPVEKIVEQAKSEFTEWDHVVKKFNHRFRNLPYELGIDNKSSVVLEGVEEPKPVLHYKSQRGSVAKNFSTKEERQYINRLLSTGERKALYLLNVMFEIEASQKAGIPHLVVLDDIVDSFDYKNKYAFLEYLCDVAKTCNYIKLVVFTHNYDFFRLLQSRLFGNYRKNSWFATKAVNETRLMQAEHFRVFGYMRDQAPTNKKMWLSMIPFARNLIEYKCQNPQDDSDYMALTECLHSLDAPHTVGEIRVIINQEVKVENSPYDDTEDIESILLAEAEEVSRNVSTGINLHDNLILAMASRRLAENYIKSKLSAPEILQAKTAENNFTRRLYEALVSKGSESRENLELLDEVNLITPEHIHVNSFMYEPLLDIGFDELKALYTELKLLVTS